MAEKPEGLHFNLEKWDGSEGKLKANIHRSGLRYLARGLKTQNPHLIWIITHLLDTGRAKIILNFVEDKEFQSQRQDPVKILKAFNFQQSSKKKE